MANVSLSASETCSFNFMNEAVFLCVKIQAKETKELGEISSLPSRN